MHPTEKKINENADYEPKSLRILRLTTIIMGIVMIFGFIIIVSLLVLTLNETFIKSEPFKLSRNFSLEKNETLSAVTYLPEYTFVFLQDKNGKKIIRIISTKTGKKFSDTLVSDLLDQESKN